MHRSRLNPFDLPELRSHIFSFLRFLNFVDTRRQLLKLLRFPERRQSATQTVWHRLLTPDGHPIFTWIVWTTCMTLRFHPTHSYILFKHLRTWELQDEEQELFSIPFRCIHPHDSCGLPGEIVRPHAPLAR